MAKKFKLFYVFIAVPFIALAYFFHHPTSHAQVWINDFPVYESEYMLHANLPDSESRLIYNKAIQILAQQENLIDSLDQISPPLDSYDDYKVWIDHLYLSLKDVFYNRLQDNDTGLKNYYNLYKDHSFKHVDTIKASLSITDAYHSTIHKEISLDHTNSRSLSESNPILHHQMLLLTDTNVVSWEDDNFTYELQLIEKSSGQYLDFNENLEAIKHTYSIHLLESALNELVNSLTISYP